MLELYQAEWCPYSHRVRARLTELGLEFTARQVPPDRDRRDAMAEATGARSIPTLVDGGEVFEGPDAILAHLDERYPETDDLAAHREKDAEEGPAWRDPERAPEDAGRRIVLVYDGSPEAQRAAERAARLAVDGRTAVVVLDERARELVRERGAEAKLLARDGEPAQAAVELAAELEAGLVVVPAGASARVLDGATCDVLVVS